MRNVFNSDPPGVVERHRRPGPQTRETEPGAMQPVADRRRNSHDHASEATTARDGACRLDAGYLCTGRRIESEADGAVCRDCDTRPLRTLYPCASKGQSNHFAPAGTMLRELASAAASFKAGAEMVK